LNSFDLLANARVEYVDAIVDYNRAQFAMFVALGQPPANSLARPVPVQGVVPANVPAPSTIGSPIGPAPAPRAAPAASTNRAPSATPIAGVSAAADPPAAVGVRGANRQSRAIPPPRDLASALGPGSR
jgi:hypothetical protein